MADYGNNGFSVRLDRIERILEVLVNSHMDFVAEHKMLLTAQVALTGKMAELKVSVQELREAERAYRRRRRPRSQAA